MSKNLNISYLLDVYGNFLPDKQRKLTEYYYNDDLSLSEIAENEGITRQGVRDSIKRAEVFMLSMEEKCNYCRKFKQLKQLASQIRDNNSDKIEELIEAIDNI